MKKRKVVTICGLAASGKGTVAKGFAKLSGFKYYDLGLLFRFGAYLVSKGLVSDLSEVKEGERFKYIWNGKESKIVFNGNDIMKALLSPEIAMKTAELASTDEGFKALSRLAESVIPKDEDIVCDGRSAGITIFPNADFKFFTHASLPVRVMRRYEDMIKAGYNTTLEQVEKEIIARDVLDMKRRIIPMENIVVLETGESKKGESARIIAEIVKMGVR